MSLDTSQPELPGGLPPAGDRMLTTCFLAALFHAILILGVTFGVQQSREGAGSAALEVVLVDERAPAAADNAHARYLAQRTQNGSGNAPQTERTRIPQSSLLPAERAGLPGGEGEATVQSATDAGEEELVATTGAASKMRYFAAPTAAAEASQAPLLLEKRPDLGMTPNDDGVQLRMRGEARRQLWIAADTRASEVAVYLDGWRRQIERVGTMNFPDVVRRRRLSGTPVIEVTIGAGGHLIAATVKRSSGQAELDQAALRILKLASPYDPFPKALAAQHDAIRIAYEWQFLDGATEGSGVLYAPPADR